MSFLHIRIVFVSGSGWPEKLVESSQYECWCWIHS